MHLIDQTIADLRFAIRFFRRSPGFAAVALGTLTLGTAALTSIFSYFNALYFAPLPYRDAARVLAISEVSGATVDRSFRFSDVSLDALQFIRHSAQAFERIAAYATDYPIVLVGREPEQITALRVDTAFVPLFDLRPQIGRLLSEEEIAANAQVAMISDVFWRTRYGADPAVVGKRITLGPKSFAIIGVMPPGFRFPWQTDVITPLREVADSGSTTRETRVSTLGKLRRGVTRDEARSELAVIAERLRRLDPKAFSKTYLVAHDEMLSRRAAQFLPTPGLFLGAGLFVLLIACANVANLFFARSAERGRELAIRASLGASRGRLIQQTLTECLLLSAGAAVAGTCAATLIVRLSLHFLPTWNFASWFHVAIDGRVLAVAVAATALVTIAVGLLPALAGTRLDLVRALKAGGAGISTTYAIRGSKRGLVLQLSLSVALFVAAALLTRSFQRLANLDVGYPAERIAMVAPIMNSDRYPDVATSMALVEDVASQSERLPNVTAAAVRGRFTGLQRRSAASKTNNAPAANRRYDPRLIADRDTAHAFRGPPFSVTYTVSDDYFRMLGLRLHVGRSFGPFDVTNGAPVAVVSAQMATQLWRTESAVGHIVQIGALGDAFRVIGVVDDVGSIQDGPDGGMRAAPGITMYLSTRQAVSSQPAILATGTGDVMAIRTAIVELVRSRDPMLTLFRETTMASLFDEVYSVILIPGKIIGALAITALLLSMIGIYGVVAFGITQRTREIGIRIALGGTTADVLRLIIGEAARFVLVGLGFGLALALALTRLMGRMLFDVSPLDPLAFALVAVTFGAVALFACYIPARRAARVDPVSALRSD